MICFCKSTQGSLNSPQILENLNLCSKQGLLAPYKMKGHSQLRVPNQSKCKYAIFPCPILIFVLLHLYDDEGCFKWLVDLRAILDASVLARYVQQTFLYFHNESMKTGWSIFTRSTMRRFCCGLHVLVPFFMEKKSKRSFTRGRPKKLKLQ